MTPYCLVGIPSTDRLFRSSVIECLTCRSVPFVNPDKTDRSNWLHCHTFRSAPKTAEERVRHSRGILHFIFQIETTKHFDRQLWHQVYICIYTFIYIYLCVCVYVYIYICVCGYVCIYVCMYVNSKHRHVKFRSQFPWCLRLGFRKLACWDCGFDSHRGQVLCFVW
jgi:hypothetical protein